MRTTFAVRFIPCFILLSLLSSVILFSCRQQGNADEIKGVEYAELTAPPEVPRPIYRNYPTKVIVKLEIQEKIKHIAEGVYYTVWTFGGTVPGSFIRVREGDLVEFHLSNHPANKMAHNIDLHAVGGPGGGSDASFTAPGSTSVFSFRASYPGLYVYHCATPPVPLHIANGMYGLIYVQPKGEPAKVDKEFYILQSEFYTEGPYGEKGLQAFSMDKALSENPDYVVFNGSVGALTGDGALKAKTGDRIRFYIGNAGPNLVSSFHTIGVILEDVYMLGGTSVIQHNVQTVLVPAGGSAIVEFTPQVPGRYIMVDHSMFRAYNKGTLGYLNVEGQQRPELFTGKQRDEIYTGEGSTIRDELPAGSVELQRGYKGVVKPYSTMSKDEIVLFGKNVFNANCVACHQSNGQGIPNVYPPLAYSDWLSKNDPSEAIKNVLFGRRGEIYVNGKKFNNVMPPVNISDDQAAAVLTYIYSELNNMATVVKPEDVAKLRGSATIETH